MFRYGQFIPMLCIAAFLLLLRSIINAILLHRHRSNLKAKWACAEPPTQPTSNFGIDNMKAFFTAIQKFDLPAYTVERHKRMIQGTGNQNLMTFRNRIGMAVQISTSDPENIKALLATKFPDFAIGEARLRSSGGFFGHAVFTADGKDWEYFRGTLRPQFTRAQVGDLDLEERHVQTAMRALPVGADGWTDVVNIQSIFFRLTMDTATEFLFGQSCHSQLTELDGQANFDGRLGGLPAQFGPSFDIVQEHLSRRGKMDTIRGLIPKPREIDEHVKVIHDFIDYFVDMELQDNSPVPVREKGAAEKYVFLKAMAADTRDRLELRSQMLQILFAGRDTTAALLSWVVRCLAEHPYVFKKLRQTVLDDFGSYSASNTSEITFASLKNCRYLQYVINETLRLHPVVPIGRRFAVRETTLPRGGGPDGTQPIFVAQNQMIEYSIYIMQRDPRLWGPDASIFRPERWSETGISGGAKRAWEYLPFSGGPRICIGQQFALTEAGYVLVRLLQRFEAVEAVRTLEDGRVVKGLEALDPFGKTRYKVSLTTMPGDDVMVRLKEAVEV